MHKDISNQFIGFHEPHNALIHIIAGVECRIANGIRPNKIRDAFGVAHKPLKIRC